MTREGTKETAEAVLKELPSVLGAFVREDVHGHPREIHLLVRSGPNPRHLAYDVRDLLEERLGIPVDQRVISIAQLAPGRTPGPMLAGRATGTTTAAAEDGAGSAPAAPEPAPRVLFGGLGTEAIDNRVRIIVRLELEGEEHRGEAVGLETAPARVRTAASATLRAVDSTCVGRARFEVEHVSIVRAFERDYVLVAVLASSPFLGRKPVTLVGAHPVEIDAETASSLAALKAVNRTLTLVLRLASGGPAPARRRPGR